MILSVSRRTDIPNYYSEWFLNRIREGVAYVRNPMNAHQVSKIDITPEMVDCIVFWTKNPGPMLHRLDELSAYPYYFQFTLTGYGRDIEHRVPHKKETMLSVFQELSDKIGKKRVIWRYDPILFSERYTPDYHLHAFEQIAEALRGYTQKCVISFVDRYRKNQKNMAAIGAYEPDAHELEEFACRLSGIAHANGMRIGSCAESIDLAQCGIEHNCCVDKALIEELTGREIKAGKDKNQRAGCGCVESVDIGTYDTCPNGCQYCYANASPERVKKMIGQYDPESPVLCGSIGEGDRVTERKASRRTPLCQH